jgi:hypothetical protein
MHRLCACDMLVANGRCAVITLYGVTLHVMAGDVDSKMWYCEPLRTLREASTACECDTVGQASQLVIASLSLQALPHHKAMA